MDYLVGLQIAIEQIKFARSYTQTLLEDINDDEWFRVPAGVNTHLAWQLGHLAMAEYGLCLFRQRGRHSDDIALMPSKFRKQFSRGSLPIVDEAENPPIAEIRSAFDRIHEQSLAEIATLDSATLAEPLDMPYAATPTKLGSLLFCSHHEMIHAGQIGLLRRLLGKQPVR